MNLDRIRRNFQNRFHLKRNRDRSIMSVEQYKTMIENLPMERLLQQQRSLLAQEPLQQRMKQVKKEVAEDETIPQKDKAEKIEEKYNDYVKMTSDDALELKLINELIMRREATPQVTTGSGMRPKFYDNTHY